MFYACGVLILVGFGLLDLRLLPTFFVRDTLQTLVTVHQTNSATLQTPRAHSYTSGIFYWGSHKQWICTPLRPRYISLFVRLACAPVIYLL
jgi:hypothetical protein